MSDFNIEKVFVHPLPERKAPLLGFARVQIEGGLFLSELRIYKDSKIEGEIYISFPTRTDKKGVEHRTVYPIKHEARVRITEAIKRTYIEILGSWGYRPK